MRHFEREKFEKEQGWTIKKMETEDQDQTLAQDCDPENLDPSPIHDEYAPVILSQETVSHIVSIDMMSGKVSVFSKLKKNILYIGQFLDPFTYLWVEWFFLMCVYLKRIKKLALSEKGRELPKV